MARLTEEEKLVAYFRGDGYSRYGFRGDADHLSPADTAIRAMREYDRLLKTEAGAAAHLALLYGSLKQKGLVPV